MRIALAGNPNSGKTTIFNALTGQSEKIGNWAGVTVEKKEGSLKKSFHSGSGEIIIVDLPGAYSMSPFTSEESVTSSYIKTENPDVIVNIVDASNLNRSLFFTTQLLELGVPLVIALNKNDLNEKKSVKIDEELLSKRLGVPVVKTISTKEHGLDMLVEKAVHIKQKPKAVFISDNVDLNDREAVRASDKKRFDFVNVLVKEVETKTEVLEGRSITDRVDDVLTNPVVGIIVFAAVMFLVFFISQSTLGNFLAEILTGLISAFQDWISGIFAGANPLLYSIVVDGIIGGVGAVMGFLPLVMVMYFIIAMLEDCGYMSRATVVLDPIFKKVGLSGKAAIPLVLGTGCSIPGIMSCRTIRNERERRTAAMLTSFMPCGAKLPVIALFAGAFFSDSIWVGPFMYLVGIVIIIIGAFLVNAINGMRYKKNYFIIELPDYKLPSLKFAALSMLERGKAYIIKAGTVILICNIVIQVMQSFDFSFHVVEPGMEGTSILATLANPFAVILIPVVGVFSWQLAAASITGFIAKENIVGTLATVFTLSNFIDTEEMALVSGGSQVASILGLTKAAALAYLMFNLFTPPCVAALGALRSELSSRKWFWGALGFQFSTGFIVGFVVYQIGTLITTGKVGEGFAGGLIAIIVIVCIIGGIIIKNNNKQRTGRRA